TGGGAAVSPLGLRVVNNSVNNVGNLGGNTFRNNIFVGTGMGGHYPAVAYDQTNPNYLSSSIFTNNIFWSQDGATDPDTFGFGYANSSYGFQGYTCAQAASMTTLSGCMNVDPRFSQAN